MNQPPIDNEHVAPGCLPFSEETIALNRQPPPGTGYWSHGYTEPASGTEHDHGECRSDCPLCPEPE